MATASTLKNAHEDERWALLQSRCLVFLPSLRRFRACCKAVQRQPGGPWRLAGTSLGHGVELGGEGAGHHVQLGGQGVTKTLREVDELLHSEKGAWLLAGVLLMGQGDATGGR